MKQKYPIELTSLRALMVSLVSFLFGLFLSWLSLSLPAGNVLLTQILKDIGSLLIVSPIFMTVWDLYLKRSFALEIFSIAKLSEDIMNSKLKEIVFDPKDVDWDSIFMRSKRMEIVFAYGKTWRGNNERILKEFVIQDKSITVFLPDPNTPQILEELGKRFQKTSGEIKIRIEEAIRDFVNFQDCAKDKSTVKIMLIPICPVFSLYKFDQEAILAFYSHSQKVSLPHFIAESGGDFYSFCDAQVKVLNLMAKPYTKDPPELPKV